MSLDTPTIQMRCSVDSYLYALHDISWCSHTVIKRDMFWRRRPLMEAADTELCTSRRMKSMNQGPLLVSCHMCILKQLSQMNMTV